MLPLYQDPWFTFRFADDRLIPRFHLDGIHAGRRVAIIKIDPQSGEHLGLLANGTVGKDGWVALPGPILVRSGEAFITVPDPKVLETDRLLLREFVMDDLEEFFRLISDPEVTRYTGDGGKTLGEARQGLKERVLQDYRKYGYGRWAAVDKTTGKVIGFAGLKYLDDVGDIDLGYRFFKEHWGKGLATEASKAILAYGFDVFQLQRIIGIADIGNKASIHVLEKVGFRFEKFTTYRDHEVAWYGIGNPQEGKT
jgi:ribosomal-protein-alanine N-acetyltransferase